MQGEYSSDRLLPVWVAEACEKLGYACTRFSNDWVIRIDHNGKRRWVINFTFDLNGAAAVGVATDKVATSLSLSSEGIPVAMHYLVRTVAQPTLFIDNLKELGDNEPVVIKPLAGSGGRGVKLMANKAEALNYISADSHPDWAMSPHYDIVSEKRAIMLDGRILCSYMKTQPYEQDGLRFFNLGKGAVAVNCEFNRDEQDLVERAFKASGLRAAAIDIATLRDGSQMILEINSGITLAHYAGQSDEHYAIARGIYYELVKAMMQ